MGTRPLDARRDHARGCAVAAFFGRAGGGGWGCAEKASSEVRTQALNDEIVPHLLRHAYGTHAKRYLGADIIDLQKAYGHKKLETTMTYLANAANPVRSPVELLST